MSFIAGDTGVASQFPDGFTSSGSVSLSGLTLSGTSLRLGPVYSGTAATTFTLDATSLGGNGRGNSVLIRTGGGNSGTSESGDITLDAGSNFTTFQGAGSVYLIGGLTANGGGGSVIARLGTGSSIGSFAVQNSSASVLFTVDSAGIARIGAGAGALGNLTIHGGTGDTSANDSVISLSRTSSTANVLTWKIASVFLNTNAANLVIRGKSNPSSSDAGSNYSDVATCTVAGSWTFGAPGTTPVNNHTFNGPVSVTNKQTSTDYTIPGSVAIANDTDRTPFFFTAVTAASGTTKGRASYFSNVAGANYMGIGSRANNASGLAFGSSSAADLAKGLLTNEYGSLDQAGTWIMGPQADVTHVIQNSSSTGSFSLVVRNANTTANSTVDNAPALVVQKGSATTGSSVSFVLFRTNAGANLHGYIVGSGTNAAVFSSTASDARLKKNIAPIGSALEKINALSPVSFEYIDEKYGAGVNEGFLAGEMEKVFPKAVFTMADGVHKNIAGWNWESAYIVKAIQELSQKLETANQRIAQLEGASL
jgi:hypothetical protein